MERKDGRDGDGSQGRACRGVRTEEEEIIKHITRVPTQFKQTDRRIGDMLGCLENGGGEVRSSQTLVDGPSAREREREREGEKSENVKWIICPAVNLANIYGKLSSRGQEGKGRKWE